MHLRSFAFAICVVGIAAGVLVAESAVGPADAAKRFNERAAKRLFFTKEKSKKKFVANRPDILSFAAPAFVPVEDSTNNNNNESVCGNFANSEKGAENRGDLNAKTGSFLANVQLPKRTSVRRLTMFANDFSAEDAHVLLVRKLIRDGLDPQFDGYEVMAQASTDGAENGVMRRFADTTIDGAKVDNRRYYYFLELVVCDAIEPFVIQVAHSRRG